MADFKNKEGLTLEFFVSPGSGRIDLDQAIFRINQTTALDFVVNLGDMTNSAYNFEYNQFLDSIHPLRYPLLSVLGNHDSIGAGPSLFRKIFGDSNFWFESTSRRYSFSIRII